MIFGGFKTYTLIDYPGKIACIAYTIGCNLRCPYCHNPELVDETTEEHISEETILSFLKKRTGMLEGIVITGGEPTMHGTALISFMEKIKACGIAIKLDTNGTHPNFLRRVLAHQLVDYIAMDIKAPLRIYQNIVGRPVDTDALKESIDLLKSTSIPYEFRTTVIKALLTREDIHDIARSISGARAYYLQKFVPTRILNPQFRRKTTYTDEEYAALQSIASPYVIYCGIRS